MSRSQFLLGCLVVSSISGCGGDDEALPPTGPTSGFATENEFSWDGSYVPDASPEGLFDDKYDGTGGRIALPPGEWDYEGVHELANWNNFSQNLGSFEPLMSARDFQFGWRFMRRNPDFSGAAGYWEGSSGVDIVELGREGIVHSYGSGHLGDGPDVLVFDQSYSLDFRTGSSLRGAVSDNDLVVMGCRARTDGSFGVITTTVHTGPGSDWVFARNLSRAGIDLGNGEGGRTDAVDRSDGDDLAVLRGNTQDFRVIGGNGDDTVVWYVDENVQTTPYLGPNFFGHGAKGDALYDGDGVDRLVLVVPAATRVVTDQPADGALYVRAGSGEFHDDSPTAEDPFASYCVECGTGPEGRKTIIFEYRRADGAVKTGYFYVTAFEELQLGVGDDARVYSIHDAQGTIELDEALEAYTPPGLPDHYCDDAAE